MDFNPLLTEIHGAIAGLSPAAQQVVNQHLSTPPPPAPAPGTLAPSPAMHAAIQPRPDAGPAPASISLPDSTPSLSMPQGASQLVTGPNRGQAMMSSGEPVKLGTTLGDTVERERLLNERPGVDNIYHNITSSGFGQNHPVLGKLLGGVAEVGGKIGDTLLNGAPGIAREIPGSTANYNSQLQRANTHLGQDIGNAQKEATTAETQARVPLAVAQTGHEQAETDALQNPQPKPKEETWKELPGYAGANGEPLEIEQNSGQVRPVAVPGEKQIEKPTKETTPQQQTYDSLIKQGMSPMQAYEKIREKPGGTVINQGTWTLDEDPTTGKPVLFNSKTGETKAAPAGVAKAGTFAKSEAKDAGAQQALNYANEYASRTLHTGPGDEALMEKFFELAKPSTGFRMSQPQIDMLKNAQSWMSGLEAHLRHATTGTWFSDEQRQQIAATMADLAKAKGIAPKGQEQGQGGPPAGAQIIKFADVK